MHAPTQTLHAPRIAIEPVSPGDVDALHRHWTAPAVRRYLWDDVVIPREQVAEIVAESERRFATEGHGLWALRPHADGALFGCAGFWTFHDPPRLELVISLDPDRWGQGLAVEAGAALVAHGFGALGMAMVQASTDAANAASRRLVERLGFHFTHRTQRGGLDTVFYEVTPETWRPPALPTG